MTKGIIASLPEKGVLLQALDEAKKDSLLHSAFKNKELGETVIKKIGR